MLWFCGSHVWMWELNHKEGWTLENGSFELWCWRRFLKVPWTARKSNQFILKEINPENSLERLTLKLKLQHFGHLIWRADSLDAGKDWRQQKGMAENEMGRWHHWLNGHEFEQVPGDGEGQVSLACCTLWDHRVRHNWVTEKNSLEY